MKTLKIAGLVALVLVVVAFCIMLFRDWTDDGSISKTTEQAEVEVFSPLAGQIIKSPLTVTGRARGNWFFEASFPVQLAVGDGIVIAQTPAQAKGDWMTNDFVPFEAKIDFEYTFGRDRMPAILVLKKDNPSGLPQYDKNISIPIVLIPGVSDSSTKACKRTGCGGELCIDEDFIITCEYLSEFDCYKNAECKRQTDGQCGWTESSALTQCLQSARTTGIRIFFSNNNLDKAITCEKAFPVERQVARTTAIARAALEELLKGPSQGELAQGFYTSINPNVKIQKLTIEGGTAKVDFDETLEKNMGGSCRASVIRTQIAETLKQFSTVKNVIISINGRIEDILQP